MLTSSSAQGPGLAIRITGEVRPDQLEIAQRCDKIFLDEIQAVPGLYRSISQAFAAVLGGVKAVGVRHFSSFPPSSSLLPQKQIPIW